MKLNTTILFSVTDRNTRQYYMIYTTTYMSKVPTQTPIKPSVGHCQKALYLLKIADGLIHIRSVFLLARDMFISHIQKVVNIFVFFVVVAK